MPQTRAPVLIPGLGGHPWDLLTKALYIVDNVHNPGLGMPATHMMLEELDQATKIAPLNNVFTTAQDVDPCSALWGPIIPAPQWEMEKKART